MNPQPSGAPRLGLLMMIMGLLGAGMVVQLVRVQFGPYAPVFDARARSALSLEERLIPERGLIYDRNGTLLATNGTMYFMEVELRQLTDVSRKEIASVLSKVLVLPIEDLYAQLTFDWPSQGQYRIRLTRVDPAAGRLPIVIDPTVAGVLGGFLADPLAPDLSGLQLVPTPRRHYPNGSLAGHLLGFVNQEGKGYFGVEGYYDEWLSGKSIIVRRSYIPPDAKREVDPPAGVNLVLTIDVDIQQSVEVALQEAVKETEAEGGHHTRRRGAVRARFDLQDPNHGLGARRRCRPVQ